MKDWENPGIFGEIRLWYFSNFSPFFREARKHARERKRYYKKFPPKITWQQVLDTMTQEQAEFVRFLRVEEGCSWRGVAAACNEEWGGDWESNQIAGMQFCEKAAPFFGEDAYDSKWN